MRAALSIPMRVKFEFSGDVHNMYNLLHTSTENVMAY